VVQPIRWASQPVLRVVPPWEMCTRPVARIVALLSCAMKAYVLIVDRKYNTMCEVL
jgi:hypothetical protein